VHHCAALEAGSVAMLVVGCVDFRPAVIGTSALIACDVSQTIVVSDGGSYDRISASGRMLAERNPILPERPSVGLLLALGAADLGDEVPSTVVVPCVAFTIFSCSFVGPVTLSRTSARAARIRSPTFRVIGAQMLDGLGGRCLYVTGDETREHVVASALRVGAISNPIYVLATRRLEEILEQARSMHAQAVAIDTIQKLICGGAKGHPGLPSQLRACTARLTDYARTTGTTLWLVGLLTARDDIAGLRTIVHDVDIVLRLDQDQEVDERILSCPKNRFRFGLDNPVGRLKLTARGFVAVDEEARAHP
jgi:hypothetical protein